MSKRTSAHGLGRGLDALFSQIEQEDEALKNDEPSGEEVKELSLNDIDINSAQPRKSFDEDALKELAESIASVGVIQPIIIAAFKRMNSGEGQVRLAISEIE